MIGYLSGTIFAIREDCVLLDVNGVGYHVFVSKRNLAGLGPKGSKAQFEIVTIAREDALHLYGFATQLEMKVFRMLTSVSGIGPKQAIQILSNSEPSQLAQAISQLDTGFLESMRGIGRKTAEKIILELKKPMAKLMKDQPVASTTGLPAVNFKRDLVLALTQLGYKPIQIDDAVAKLPKDDMSLEEAIKQCLSTLAGSNNTARP